jgi:hypothetical protein
MPQGNPTSRLQFDLSREKLEEIERLRVEGGFDTKKDLFNNAVTLIKWAIRHASDGHAIAAIDEGSAKYFELQMPFLAHVASKRLKSHGG